MNRDGQQDLVIQAVGDRRPGLSEASLRISESPGLNTAVWEIADSVRAPARDRCGAMTLPGDGAELFARPGPRGQSAGRRRAAGRLLHLGADGQADPQDAGNPRAIVPNSRLTAMEFGSARPP